MTVLRKLSAATLVAVLTLLPAALEQCRAACMGHPGGASVAATAHPCHDMAASEDAEARIDPLPAACGHNEPGRAPETTGIAPLKLRSDGDAMAALIPVPPIALQQDRSTAAAPPISRPPHSRSSTLNAPLRL